MPFILSECALHLLRQRPTNWTSLIKVIFKFFLALKQWLVSTIFSATILLHLRTHSSKKYPPIFLHIFILIFLIISPMNTPWRKNQFILSTLPLLHSTPTIHFIFLKYFCIFFYFYAIPNFTARQVQDDIKRPPAEDDRRPVPAPGSQKPPRLARDFNRSFHSTADHPYICRKNCWRSKKMWLFQPINPACSSKRALSPTADSKCSSHRSPYKECRKVANRAEIGGIVYTNPACPLYCRVASRHNSSPNNDRDEYICRSSAPNAASSEL